MKKEEKSFKQISLLPSRLKNEIMMLKIMRIAVSVTSVILIISAIFFIVTPILNISKNLEINKIEMEIQKIREQIGQMPKVEEDYNKFRAYSDILTKAMGNPPNWSTILSILATKPLTVFIDSAEQVTVKGDSVIYNAQDALDTKNTEVKPQTEATPTQTLKIKCIITNTTEFDNWIESISRTPGFEGITIGTFQGNQYGYTTSITIPVPKSPSTVFSTGGLLK